MHDPNSKDCPRIKWFADLWSRKVTIDLGKAPSCTCQPTVGEGKKCAECQFETSAYVLAMVGESHSRSCSKHVEKVWPSPTPDVQQIVKDYAETFTALKEHDEAEEGWVKELEEQDWYETFTQTWQEDQCKGFIHRILSQHEARVRDEAYQAGIRRERERCRVLICPCGCSMFMDENGYEEEHSATGSLLTALDAELHGNK